MALEFVPVDARSVVFTDGTSIEGAGDTGFVLKDGSSRLAKDLKPGDEFADGKVIKEVLDEGKTLKYLVNVPEPPGGNTT